MIVLLLMRKEKNMKNIISKLRKNIDTYLPISAKVGLTSMCFSMIVAFVASVLCYALFRNEAQVFHDIVVDYMGYYDDNKSCDFYAYYSFVLVYIITFFISNRVLNLKVPTLKCKKKDINLFHVIIAILPNIYIWLLHKGGIHGLSVFAISLITLFIVTGVLLYHTKISKENIVKLICSLFYIYLSLAGVLALVAYIYPALADKVDNYFIQILWVLLAIDEFILYIFIYGKHNNNIDKIVDKITSITQLIIPLGLFCIINIRYIHKGNEVELMNYDRFRILVILSIIILILINFFMFYKANKANERIDSVNVTTIITFSTMLLWNTSYNLVIVADQAHTGETEIVYNQITNFGLKWGKEFVSMLQGLGFSNSALNEFIFGGTFATYVQTQNLALIFAVVLTAIALYYVIERKDRWLLLFYVPIMPLFLLNRTFFVGLVFIFLVNPKIIRNPMKWTYCYILTCIIHVWYQPTYGGAVAASLIPVGVIIWYNTYKKSDLFKNHKNRLKIILFFASVVIIGISCIPMLLQAIHFLKINGYETINGNGITIKQSFAYGITTLTKNKVLDAIIYIVYKFGSGLLACAVMLYVFVRYVINERDYIRRIQGVILTVSATFSYFLILPASFTRIDAGICGVSRIGAVSFIYFSCIIVLLLYIYRDVVEYKTITLILCGVFISAGFYVSTPDYLQVHTKVNTIVQVPETAQYVTPEETGLKKLGYAFIEDTEYLKEAIVINEICSSLLSENQTYYDFTDKSIYYNYANKKVPGLYAAQTTVKSYYTQIEAISQLKKNDVPIIFINNPKIMMLSLSSYRIYRYFMQQDYKFVSYKGVKFLIRNDIDMTPIQDNIDKVDNCNLLDIDTNKIDEKIYNSTLLDNLTFKPDASINDVELVNRVIQVSGVDPFVIFNLNQNVNLNNADLVEINLKNEPVDNMKGQLFVQTESVVHNQSNSVQFDIRSKKVLVPLYNLEQFSFCDKLLNFRLDFDNVAIGTDVSIDSIKLYSLNNIQKNDIEENYLKSNVMDNRLDEAFHLSNLNHLAHEWGESFEHMKDRFSESKDAKSEQEKVQVGDTPITVHFNMKQIISGREGEFLRLKLDYGDDKQRAAAIIINGTDKRGNALNEEFQFITVSDNMLIPIASSPNCLQAKELTSFDVTFSPDIEPYEVKIEDAQMYQLIK